MFAINWVEIGLSFFFLVIVCEYNIIHNMLMCVNFVALLFTIFEETSKGNVDKIHALEFKILRQIPVFVQ